MQIAIKSNILFQTKQTRTLNFNFFLTFGHLFFKIYQLGVF